jgi:hypothetical protein
MRSRSPPRSYNNSKVRIVERIEDQFKPSLRGGEPKWWHIGNPSEVERDAHVVEWQSMALPRPTRHSQNDGRRVSVVRCKNEWGTHHKSNQDIDGRANMQSKKSNLPPLQKVARETAKYQMEGSRARRRASGPCSTRITTPHLHATSAPMRSGEGRADTGIFSARTVEY